MRSIQLLAPRILEEREISQPPDPGPGEVAVRIRAVGICGSDLHWYLDGRVGQVPAIYPQILGHEPCAEIVQTGAGVESFRAGDRVVIEPSLTCGHCEPCLTGRHNLCPSCRFMGGPAAHGMFREFVTLPAHNVTPVPAGLSDDQATLAEPLAVLMHLLELVEIRAGSLVAVCGAGPIGMLTAAVAKTAGALRVWICDPLPHRLELARTMGADCRLESTQRMNEAIADQTRGRGVDLAIDAAGTPETIHACILAAKRGGTVVLIGIPSAINPPFDLHTAMGKELKIQALFRSNHRAEAALQLLEAGRIPTALITHQLPLGETPRGFQMLTDYTDGVGKIIVRA